MGFPITTRTIVVIIDMTQFIIIFISLYISFVFLYIYKNPHLVGRGQAILVASFLYLGFSKWKSIFRVIRSVIKLLQLKTESKPKRLQDK